MFEYIENPKTKGSGIVCCIPQKGVCPMKCDDCFFQSGRSYLEPLDQHLPNIPDPNSVGDIAIVRVNDGNDSNNKRDLVEEVTSLYPRKFYNTSINRDLDKFDAPVVLTVNPGALTNSPLCMLLEEPPKNLMFVRYRTNMWNLDIADTVIEHYSARSVPIVLTFMAYYSEESIPIQSKHCYIYRKRTLNSYWAITTDAWERVMARYKYNKWVYSCGKIEGEKGVTGCRFCGNCLREYFATMERLAPFCKTIEEKSK
ncbi:MAG: hypothetical protein WC346_03105 [Methanogenium sp.]|jgi:hypothetical protein